MEIQNFIESDQESVSGSFLQSGIRCSQTENQVKSDWDKLIVSALQVAEQVNPFQTDLPEGTILRAVDAMGHVNGYRNCDIRPRLLDRSSGINRLVDSGSQISVTKRGPNDKIDDSLKLVAVNGTKIPTYGVKEIQIKINRKSYSIPAVVCDIHQDILGMDFINK